MICLYHKYIMMYINNGKVNSFHNIINNKLNKHIRRLEKKISISNVLKCRIKFYPDFNKGFKLLRLLN